VVTPGGELRGLEVVRVHPASPHALGAEAIAPAKSPDPGAGQEGPHAMEVPSPTRVEQPETLPLEVTARTTQTRTLDPRSLEDETGTRTLVPPTLTVYFYCLQRLILHDP